MFLKPDSLKSNGKSSPFSHGIIPVLSALDLLQIPRHQLAQQEILTLLAQPDEFFQEAVNDLIANYAEFVQLIAAEDEPNLGSLLDLGLRRAKLVLELMRESDIVAELQDPLFLYATFSAALLSEIRQVFSNKKIILSDAAGNYIDEWLPFTASLLVETDYYRVRPYYLPLQQVNPYVAPLLARQLLPAPVFNWLASDLSIFDQWFAALTGDEERGGRVGYWLSLIKVKLVPSPQKIEGFPVKIHDAIETELGDEFFEWLNEHLIELVKRQQGIQVVDEGILIAFPLLFRKFCQTKSNVEPNKVLQQFKQLGILEDSTPVVDLHIEGDKAQIKTESKKVQEGKKLPADFFRRTQIKTPMAQTTVQKKQTQQSTSAMNPEVEKALWFFVTKEWLLRKAWQKISKDTVGKLNLANKVIKQLRRLHQLFARRRMVRRMMSIHK